MVAVPELRGGGIVLSAHAEDDVAAHVAGEDEETARRFGWWPARSTEETVRAAYAGWARNWRDNGPVRAFAARDPDTGVLAGGCELRIQPDGTGEVAYWTHAGQRGRGHARNALELLAGYAASIGVTRLEAHVAVSNRASRRVAESAGFAQSGTFTDDDGTEMIRYTRKAPGSSMTRPVSPVVARPRRSPNSSSPSSLPGSARNSPAPCSPPVSRSRRPSKSSGPWLPPRSSADRPARMPPTSPGGSAPARSGHAGTDSCTAHE